MSLNLMIVKDSISSLNGIRHFYHLLVAPDDLYNPIVTDNFLFYKKGFQKTYTLHPKYFDSYDLSIAFLNKYISSKYKFSGKLLVEFLYKGEVISKKIADQIITAGYVGSDTSEYKEIALLTFEIPIIGKYKDNISVRITVLEPDQELEKYRDFIMLQMAVSSTP
jgi:hypothetical protein